MSQRIAVRPMTLSRASAEQAGRQDARVVDDDDRPFGHPVGQVPDVEVSGIARGGQVEEAGGEAVLGWDLRDRPRREVVMEQVDAHGRSHVAR